MFKGILKVSLFLLAIGFVYSSCSSSDEDENRVIVTEEDIVYAEESTLVVTRDGNSGMFGCYEFIFPINVDFPDSTSLSVESYEDMEEKISEWRAVNREFNGFPRLGFPFDVLTDEGEVIGVESRRDLVSLTIGCFRNFFENLDFDRFRDRGRKCFDINYPVNMSFPDGSRSSADSPRDFLEQARDWRSNNREVEGRVKVGFPISVTLEDGTVVDVESAEALKQLKKDCRG